MCSQLKGQLTRQYNTSRTWGTSLLLSKIWSSWLLKHLIWRRFDLLISWHGAAKNAKKKKPIHITNRSKVHLFSTAYCKLCRFWVQVGFYLRGVHQTKLWTASSAWKGTMNGNKLVESGFGGMGAPWGSPPSQRARPLPWLEAKAQMSQ